MAKKIGPTKKYEIVVAAFGLNGLEAGFAVYHKRIFQAGNKDLAVRLAKMVADSIKFEIKNKGIV